MARLRLKYVNGFANAKRILDVHPVGHIVLIETIPHECGAGGIPSARPIPPQKRIILPVDANRNGAKGRRGREETPEPEQETAGDGR